MSLGSGFTGFTSHRGLQITNNMITGQTSKGHGAKRWLRYGRNNTSHAAISFDSFPALGTVADGSRGIWRVRIVFRLPSVAPSHQMVMWSGYVGGSVFHRAGVLLNTDRTLQTWVNTVNGGAGAGLGPSGDIGTASSPIPLGFADNEGWVTLDLEVENFANGGTDQITANAHVYFADGTDEALDGATQSGNWAASLQFQSPELFGSSSGTGFTSSGVSCEIDVAQYILIGATNADYASAPALPPVGTRVARCLITGNGGTTTLAYNGSNDWWILNKQFDLNTLTGESALQTTTAGEQRTLTHQGVARLGATQTYGVRLLQWAQGTGSGTSVFLVGGATQNGVGTLTTNNHCWYTDFTSRDQATFDAMEVGVQSVVTAGTYYCGAFEVEVLHNGAAYDDDELNLGGGYQQAWLAWTGDGAVNRVLTGAGFRPHFALLFTVNASTGVKIATDVAGHVSMQPSPSYNSESFRGFESDGLRVGHFASHSWNENGVSYIALLVRDDGSPVYDVSGETPAITGYTFLFTTGLQNNVTNSHAQVIDFGETTQLTPGNVFVVPGAAAGGVAQWKTPDMSATQSAPWYSTGATVTTAFTSLDANGFTLSTLSLVSTTQGPWWAWSSAAALADLVRTLPVPAVTALPTTTGISIAKDELVTFEDDADVTEPVLGTTSHALDATNGSSVTIPNHTVDAGDNRHLVVGIITYGDTGTRSCTYDGVAMTEVLNYDIGSMRVHVYEMDDPPVGSADVVWSSTTNNSSRNITAFSFRDTSGIRWALPFSGLSVYLATRLKDLVVAMISTDPLDSGQTLTSPGSPWTELYNDGSVSACGAAVVRSGADNAEVGATWVESSGVEVTGGLIVGMMPAGLLAWNPYFAMAKGDQLNAVVARYRLDEVAFGTNNASVANQTLVANGLTAMGAESVSVYRWSTTDPVKAAQAWMLAIAGAGSVVALSPPTSVDDAYSTPFETQLVVAVGSGVLANDNTNGGGTMTALLVDDVGVGTLSLASDGSFTYDPPLGFAGSTTFTYRAVNDGGNGTLATVTITVLAQTSTDIPVILEMRFGDGYRAFCANHASILAHYYLSDVGASQAADEIPPGDAGIYTGSPVNGRGMLPEFGLSKHFDGSTQWVTLDWDAIAPATDSPFSISLMVRPAAGGLGAVQCLVSATATGFWLGLDASNRFAFGKNGGTKCTATDAVTADTVYHVVGTYDGTDVNLYVDGVLVAGPTTVSIGPNAGADVYIARNNSEEFEGDIQGVALFGAELSLSEVEELYDATAWVDVSDWARGTVPITVQRGIQGDDPRQRLAPTGIARFGLNNFAVVESGATLGYWSPGHVNCRAGFQRGIPVRISFDTGIQFIGTLRDIKPSADVFGDRVVMCFCTDWMDEAARFSLDGIETQASITADEAIELLLARMPNKPHELSLGVGTDTYEIALDSTQKNQKVQAELGRLAMSELGLIYVAGDGTLVFEPRGTRISGSATSVATIDNEMVQCDVDHTTDQLLNLVRITVHPRRVDSGAATILYATDTRVRIDNGVTDAEMFFPFRDPAQEAASVAGLNVNTPVATTDYTLNTAEDGSGTDVTGDPSIDVAWRIDAKGIYLIVSNGYGLPVYLDLEVTGDGVYDFTPITLTEKDDTLIRRIGVQEVELDLHYQSSTATARDAAQWLLNTYADEASRLRSIRFRPTGDSLTLFNAALDVEIGSRVTIAEDLTAIDGDYFVNAIQHTWVGEGQVLTQWWLARANTEDFWVMDVSELDVTTRLSY